MDVIVTGAVLVQVKGGAAGAAVIRRTRLLPESATYKLPALSTARPIGPRSEALADGPPSPAKPPVVRPPAMVLIFPLVSTLRMTLLLCEMKRLPAPSTPMPTGATPAEIAGPPSPWLSGLPLPATVEMIPAVVYLRTRKFSESEIYRFPEASSARN